MKQHYEYQEKILDEIIAIKNNIIGRMYIMPVTTDEIKRLRQFKEEDCLWACNVQRADLNRMEWIL
jgi:hypothetical protein